MNKVFPRFGYSVPVFRVEDHLCGFVLPEDYFDAFVVEWKLTSQQRKQNNPSRKHVPVYVHFLHENLGSYIARRSSARVIINVFLIVSKSEVTYFVPDSPFYWTAKNIFQLYIPVENLDTVKILESF